MRIIHDREGETVNIWFNDRAAEYTVDPSEDGILIMRAEDGRVLGVEVCGLRSGTGRERGGRMTKTIFVIEGEKVPVDSVAGVHPNGVFA